MQTEAQPDASFSPGQAPSGATAPRPDRTRRREQAAVDALRTLIRDQVEQRFGAPETPWPPLTLTLRLRVDPAAAWAVACEPGFAEQIEQQVTDQLAEPGALSPGHVYCFRCRSAHCGHATPPTALAVFKGYSSTGVAEWQELPQAFLDAGDERVDQLYATPPVLLAMLQRGHDLRTRQLTPFGRASKTYALLGQLVAGFFLLPDPADPRRATRHALTVQLVESRAAPGVAVLALNAIVAGLDGAAREDALAGPWYRSLARPLETAARDVERLQERVQAALAAGDTAAARQRLGTLPRVLGELARALEQASRRGIRRTQHADAHARDARPVHKAVEDALEARAEELFHDAKRGTTIVCGRQGRTHAFSAAGRHVTSFTTERGSVGFRVRTERWMPLTGAEAAAFRSAVRASLATPAAPATSTGSTP